MKIESRHYRSIWLAADGRAVEVIDQTRLPFEFATRRWESVEDAASGIRDMTVRGAPLIGAAAAWGLALAMARDPGDAHLADAAAMLLATRPTAVNLRWAIEDMTGRLATLAPAARRDAAFARAQAICDEDVAINAAIGEHGLALMWDCWARKRQRDAGARRLDVLTHCNAGWLATVDWGTALSPIYRAHDAGLPIHVWVDETRPRNQGAALTAWELGAHGVPHTLIVDNAGGHLMQRGMVDLCIVGADRVTRNGDVCNKIGTYLKALAAGDCGVPFHVAVPSPTIDWTIADGRDVPIEERSAREVTHLRGRDGQGCVCDFALTAPTTAAANPAFDLTPARLVTSLITERGIAPATAAGLAAMFADRRKA